MRRVAIACLLAGCGRLGFDAPGSTSDANAPADGGASIAPVQVSGVVTGTGDLTVPVMPTQAGTLLVATIGANDASGLVLPAGWQSNASGTSSGACDAVIATSTSQPAGTTVIDFGFGNGQPAVVQVTEWEGLGGIDNGGFGGTGSPTTTYSVRTVAADATPGDLAIAVFCENAASAMFQAGTGYTKLGSLTLGGGLPAIVAEYGTDEPAATVTATATSSASTGYSATILTFLVP